MIADGAVSVSENTTERTRFDMTTFAKITSRKLHDGTRRYSFDYKRIAVGERSRWPFLSMDRFESRADALVAAEQRGWVVVKTWEQAEQLANVASFDGCYHSTI